MRLRITKQRVVWLLLIIAVLLIWGQSVMPVSASQKESSGFLHYFIWPIEKLFTGVNRISEGLVRKLAHGFEFGVLGMLMTLVLRDKKPLRALSYCGCIALLDETIQIFAKRGSQISDVWIDSLGATVGIAIGMMVIAIWDRSRMRIK